MRQSASLLTQTALYLTVLCVAVAWGSAFLYYRQIKKMLKKHGVSPQRLSVALATGLYLSYIPVQWLGKITGFSSQIQRERALSERWRDCCLCLSCRRISGIYPDLAWSIAIILLALRPRGESPRPGMTTRASSSMRSSDSAGHGFLPAHRYSAGGIYIISFF